VHGIGNLHIASGSVFPTSSQANPTLTILALALRVTETVTMSLQERQNLVVPKPANAPQALPALVA
jgi:choline dehydrogenase-like flavoprotein